MPEGFTTASCPTDVGLTDAENMVEEKLDLITNEAEDVLKRALALEDDLRKVRFPRLAIKVGFDGAGQLDTFEIPDRPEISDKDLDYEKPDVPGTPELSSIQTINPNTNFPRFSDGFLATLISTLTNMLANTTTLPDAWVEANWAKARDRLSRDESARIAEVQGEFARRGWAAPSGVETARVDAIRNEFIGQLSALNRDIAIKVYEEALISLRLAAQLGVDYLNAWVDAYAAYINAVSEDSKNRIRRNEYLLQRMEAAIKIFDAEIRAEDSRIDAVLKAYALDYEAYDSDIKLREAISRHDQAKFAQETERRKIEADVLIQDNQSKIAARARDVQERSQNFRTRADVLRQLGAALWQAVNVGASTSVGYSRSRSSGCSTNYSYSESA